MTLKSLASMDAAWVRRVFYGLCVCLALSWATQGDPVVRKTRVLVIQGGHDFETNQFFAIFSANSNITYRVVQHPAAQEWFGAEHAADYDVLVLYDMWPSISEVAKSNLTARLNEGKGLVALHHSLASYQSWDGYADIIGGKYHLKEWRRDGTEHAASTYQHDVDFTVHISDRNHPITRGLEDFEIRDEAYGGTELKPGSHVLLSTRQPLNSVHLAWTSPSVSHRVVYIQLGHDHQAYGNPIYRRLLGQAIQWVSRA